MSSLNTERVLNVRHWNDTLFSFTTTRNPGLRFENGQFVMMGLEVNGKPLLRAYSSSQNGGNVNSTPKKIKVIVNAEMGPGAIDLPLHR